LPHVLLRSGANGIPAGGAFAPQLFSFAKSVNFTSREIPMWDDVAVLINGDYKTDPPMLYPATGGNGFAQALNALGDASQLTADACRIKPNELQEKSNLVPTPLPGCPGTQAVSETLWAAIKNKTSRSTCLYGTPLMSSNALVWTVFRSRLWAGGSDPELAYNGRMSDVNSDMWRVEAISRADQSVLFTVDLPGAPAPTGMSLTRTGDILVPLVDGRVVCIGNGVAVPSAATTATNTAPALQMEAFPTDFMEDYYHAWTPEDLDGMTLMKKGIASLNYKDSETNTLVCLRGYLNIPTTGAYTFSAKGRGTFNILDASERFIVGSVLAHAWGDNTRAIYLEKGLHPVSAFLWPVKDGKSLNVQWSGPDITRSDIPDSALSHPIELTPVTKP